MPITPENFENFCVGMSAETFVASRFAMAGFECHKISPDPGVDFLVTNIARRRFRDDSPIAVELQVKSTLLRSSSRLVGDSVTGNAVFWMSDAERDYLIADPHRMTAFVIFHSMRQVVDPNTFDYLHSRVDGAIDQDIATDQDRLLAEHGRRMPGGVQQSVLRINRFETECFWLNGRQLEKTVEAGVWREGSNGLAGLSTRLADGNLFLGDLNVVPECRDLIFMLGCSAQQKLAEGRFSYDDL